MPTIEPAGERAREIIEAINRQCDIDHGVATAWCPDLARALFEWALIGAERCGAERMRERAAKIAYDYAYDTSRHHANTAVQWNAANNVMTAIRALPLDEPEER